MVLQITLDEAKHYVARAHNLTTTQVAVEIPPRVDLDASNSFMVEVAAGRKLNAIKIYREVTGCGLKEAKDAVDDFADRFNRLNSRL